MHMKTSDYHIHKRTRNPIPRDYVPPALPHAVHTSACRLNAFEWFCGASAWTRCGGSAGEVNGAGVSLSNTPRRTARARNLYYVCDT